ncbi:FAD-binding oxidoreductase [Pseudonocardia charpentierae]|uniref:FAD-binding oxidoreductase n=1 Tax=Pseudonocardia charpentierae TaxID=3075545 RepID=A0ABU2NBH7_9PSEU|nr:FAD-binding oxidoreductase [Pseudonocardia sp. DSM 45834]MDT0351300.1 FAD-binding oxidoreductase [Pseudonocardia sp. DSM 45834]
MHTSTLPVVTPSDADHAADAAGYNRIVTHHPRLVVGARDTPDVVAAVRYAADAGLAVGVQATGHGVSVPADGVLVSTRRMREVKVDPATRTVRVAAGVRGRDLTAALVPHGLAPVGGSSPDVGVVGYHLGGGLPLLGRTFGYAADLVRALDVVTADGTSRTVTPDTEPDLFWALLGCRGSFGVVTALVTEALPLTSVVGGGLWFVDDAIAPAVHRWLEWTAGLPETMNSSVLLMRLPDIPAIPEAVRGRRIAHVRIAYVGPPTEATALLAPLRAVGPVRDTVAELPVGALGSIHDEPSGPVVFESRNSLLGPLDPAGASVLLGHADSDTFLVEVRHLGGALARADGRAVVGRRDGEFVLYTGSALATPADREPAAAAQARLHEALGPWGIGAVTPAFLAGPHVSRSDLHSAYTPGDRARLRDVKRRWDPADMFRVAQVGTAADLSDD